MLRPRRAIVFINTPEEISRAADKLRRAGLQAQSLSGSQKKLERQRALTAFADGEAPLLIASDLAARGLHVEGVDMIFHVTLPESPLDYLHRAGRTGRGAAGLSVVLAKFRERALTGQYERALDFQFIDKQLDGDRRRLLPVPGTGGERDAPPPLIGDETLSFLRWLRIYCTTRDLDLPTSPRPGQVEKELTHDEYSHPPGRHGAVSAGNAGLC